MSSAALIFILDITVVLAIARGQDSTCPGGTPVTYVKMVGLVPQTRDQPSILYAAVPGMAITAECYNRCKHTLDCTGFIIDYSQGACYKVNLHKQEQEQYLFAPNSSYFKKVCFQVPPHCIKRAWPVEIAPNTQLIGFQHTTIAGVVDKWHCAQFCLTGKTEYGRQLGKPPCKSAQYQAWSRTCTLSGENKRSQPEAYGPDPTQQTDYIENQCAEYPDPPGTSCWHEPLYNRTIPQVDLQIENIPIEQCRDRCETEEYFKCRGFTYKCPAHPHGGSICYLHSDDSHNRVSLVHSSCATYVEKLSCIDLKVSCDRANMLVTYRSPGFQGRLFSLGHSDYCGVIGTNQPLTTLALPLPSPDPAQYNQCGVIQARSNSDRTLATAVIVVQQHPIIQTIADRVVKVSCVMSDVYGKGLVRPDIPNITLETDFGVADPKVQTGILADNTNSLPSSITPHAHLRIVDLQHGGLEASETQLGQDLELAIDIEPPFNVSMVRAGHLVASSGDGRDSLLLLDYRGCPPDVLTFPALTPHPDPGVNALSAVFKAFRFPSSPILRFSLVLTFCETVCVPIDCGNGLQSYGKRRRRDTLSYNQTDHTSDNKPQHRYREETTPRSQREFDNNHRSHGEFDSEHRTQDKNDDHLGREYESKHRLNGEFESQHRTKDASDNHSQREFDKEHRLQDEVDRIDNITESNIRQKVPLQLSIIVRPLYDSSLSETAQELNLADGATSRQISGIDESNSVCMEWSTALTISLLWLFLQLCFFLCCCYILYCRPRYKRHQDQDSLQIDFQPRHVTWASDNTRQRH